MNERMVEPLTLGERIKKVRRDADLTQQEFGKRIGIKPNSISLIESGNRNASEQVILSVCREFKISETWLRTGEGVMFRASPTDALDTLAEEQHLTHGDYVFIEKFLKMKFEKRQAVMEFMLEFSKDILDGDVPIDTPAINTSAKVVGTANASSAQEMSDDDLHAELDRQLAEEKKQADGQAASGHGNSEKATG